MLEKVGQANIPKTLNIFVFYRAIGKSGNLEDQRRLHGGGGIRSAVSFEKVFALV